MWQPYSRLPCCNCGIRHWQRRQRHISPLSLLRITSYRSSHTPCPPSLVRYCMVCVRVLRRVSCRWRAWLPNSARSGVIARVLLTMALSAGHPASGAPPSLEQTTAAVGHLQRVVTLRPPPSTELLHGAYEEMARLAARLVRVLQLSAYHGQRADDCEMLARVCCCCRTMLMIQLCGTPRRQRCGTRTKGSLRPQPRRTC